MFFFFVFNCFANNFYQQSRLFERFNYFYGIFHFFVWNYQCCGSRGTKILANSCSVVDAAAVNLNGIKTLLDNGLSILAGIYLLKVNNRNARTRCEICSKLTKKTSERHQWRRSGVFIVNFEYISHLVLGFLLLTLNI